MFYKNWMSYIKDDAKITKIAMPGSHNAGTMGMNKFARCQNGSLYDQYAKGVRFFDIRMKADKKGNLFMAHGICNGMPAERVFESFKAILDESDEFFVVGLRTYMNQSFGPIKLSYNGNPDETSRLIRKYLNPEKYALTDIENISEMTIGDIRKSGKKYIIINANAEYDFSVKCPLADPWDATVYGYKPQRFAVEILKYLKEIETDGFFWFQTQQTPNLNTENGWAKWPTDLDKMSRPYFPHMMREISADPLMLGKVNIVAGDFMEKDTMKANKILALNLQKGIVKDELKAEYTDKISK